MFSWRGADGGSRLGGFITILLGDVGVVRGASSETLRDQQVVQVDQGRERHARGADRQPGAGERIEHPCRHHRDHAGGRLDVDELTRCAPLAVKSTDAAPGERMPAVVDDDFLPDMGRMTRGWP